VTTMRGGAEAARRAHNPKVPGSNPGPATQKVRNRGQSVCGFLLLLATDLYNGFHGNDGRHGLSGLLNEARLGGEVGSRS
jgi:hypothetical protein